MANWTPTRQQEEALRDTSFEVLMGGARGGGKTVCGMAWLLYGMQHPACRALVVRRNATDLQDWHDRARTFYALMAVEVVGNPPEFRFPNGAIIRTGHLKDENAYEKYQGHEYQRMVIEELTQIPREDSYLKLIASCRSTVPGLKPQIFASTNPGGPGSKWVQKRFHLSGTPRDPIRFLDETTGLSRAFIPARITDNPYLMENDPGYVRMLDGLPDGLREAWRDGSWDSFHIEGAYYTKELQQARNEGRIGNVPVEQIPTYTVWDLGISDYTTILFVQFVGKEIRLVDFYQNHGEGLLHYVKLIQSKGYLYSTHWFPHDIEQRELVSGRSRKEALEEMGIQVEVVRKHDIADGIQAVRTIFPRLWIDQIRCDQFLDAITQYRQKWSDALGRFHDNPMHDWSSHASDVLRYTAMAERQMTWKPTEEDRQHILDVRRRGARKFH